MGRRWHALALVPLLASCDSATSEPPAFVRVEPPWQFLANGVNAAVLLDTSYILLTPDRGTRVRLRYHLPTPAVLPATSEHPEIEYSVVETVEDAACDRQTSYVRLMVLFDSAEGRRLGQMPPPADKQQEIVGDAGEPLCRILRERGFVP
jgi:hypothetical protein